jgi:hypothetical protein
VNDCYDCSGAFRVYVTDCNGSVILDAGMKDCDGASETDPNTDWFYWKEAPDHYCVYVYSQSNPRISRYLEFQNTDSCMVLGGDEENWNIDHTDMNNCIKAKCSNLKQNIFI